MAVPIVAKAVETISKVAEEGVKRSEPGEPSGGAGELGKKLPELEDPRKIEVPEIPKEGRPPIDVIKTESLQQLVEENKAKINEVRNALNEDAEGKDEEGVADNPEQTQSRNKNRDCSAYRKRRRQSNQTRR